MLSIAIPSSSLINERDEKIKAYKVGMIARAAAIFRVDEIVVYHDPLLDETDYIVEILEYLETPQYLRKLIFPLKKSLKYAGVLPPLTIPSHRSKHLKVGEIREGVVRYVAPDGTRWVEIGIDALAPLRSTAPKGARVTVRICSKKPLLVEEVEPQEYWGYKVKKVKLKDLMKRENLVVTSRRCRVPEFHTLRRDVTLVFGNPEEGVFEIASRLGIKMEVECWNVVPQQGTKTVRLEEAIFAALSLVNFASYWGGLR